jgi:hypothetical protein
VTGPEHYKAAEDLTAHAADLAEQISDHAPNTSKYGILRDEMQCALAKAQIHAGLASVAVQAATMLPNGSKGRIPWLRLALGDPDAFTEESS